MHTYMHAYLRLFLLQLTFYTTDRQTDRQTDKRRRRTNKYDGGPEMTLATLSKTGAEAAGRVGARLNWPPIYPVE